MKKFKWNLKLNNRRYEVEYVRGGQITTNGLFVNGQKIASPKSKWYLPFKMTHHFVLNDQEVILIAWGTDCDLIVDGRFVEQNREAAPFRHDLHAWIGHVMSLGCLAIIPAFYQAPACILLSILLTVSNEIITFSPLRIGWKKTLYNAINLALAWVAAFALANLLRR